MYRTCTLTVSQACPNPEERLNRIEKTLRQLPTENFNILQKLFNLLSKVAEGGNENGMTADVLGTLWAPTLFRSNVKGTATVTVTLIEHSENMFAKKEKPLPKMSQPPSQQPPLKQPQHPPTTSHNGPQPTNNPTAFVPVSFYFKILNFFNKNLNF